MGLSIDVETRLPDDELEGVVWVDAYELRLDMVWYTVALTWHRCRRCAGQCGKSSQFCTKPSSVSGRPAPLSTIFVHVGTHGNGLQPLVFQTWAPLTWLVYPRVEGGVAITIAIGVDGLPIEKIAMLLGSPKRNGLYGRQVPLMGSSVARTIGLLEVSALKSLRLLPRGT